MPFNQQPPQADPHMAAQRGAEMPQEEDGWIYPEIQDPELAGMIRMRESMGSNGILDDEGNRFIIEKKTEGSWKRVTDEDEGHRILAAIGQMSGMAEPEPGGL